MQDLEKSGKVKWFCEIIINVVTSYESDAGHKIYFDYDSVLKLLEQAQEVTIDTARCPRPENLPSDMPWCERLYGGDEVFDPYAFDGTMSTPDYEKMYDLMQRDEDEESEDMER